MKSPTLSGSVRYASGEELLLLAVFGAPRTKRVIDRELDRRAVLRRDTMRFRTATTLPTKRAAQRGACARSRVRTQTSNVFEQHRSNVTEPPSHSGEEP